MTAPTQRQTGPGRPRHRHPVDVALGESVIVGGSRPLVFGPPGTGADIVHVRPGSVSRRELARLSESVPVVVEVADSSEMTGIGESAAAVVVRDDAEVCAGGRPVLLRLTPGATVKECLAAVDQARTAVGDAGVIAVAVSEPAALAELRRRAAVPVIADVSDRPELAGVAVAAGVDGIWLSSAATAASVGQVRESVTRLAPLVRQVVPDTLAGCREAIDAVDAVVATLLEQRVALAGRIQRLKPVGGRAGRDRVREAEIVRGMAARAPSLPDEHLARIMGTIIDAGLDVAERDVLGNPPVWRL